MLLLLPPVHLPGSAEPAKPAPAADALSHVFTVRLQQGAGRKAKRMPTQTFGYLGSNGIAEQVAHRERAIIFKAGAALREAFLGNSAAARESAQAEIVQ